MKYRYFYDNIYHFCRLHEDGNKEYYDERCSTWVQFFVSIPWEETTEYEMLLELI